MSTAAPQPGTRDPIATIAALHQALTLMPDNVDAMVGLGGLYLRVGRLDDAMRWCQQALARKPEHVPARKVLQAIGDAYVETGMGVAITGDLATTIDVFARAVACGHADARHYHALFRQAQSWFKSAQDVKPAANSARLGLAVWGEAYVAAAATLFRSLLAPGNVPALAARGPVILEISSSEGERALFENMPSLQALRDFVQIDYFIIDPDVLSYDRGRTPGFQYWIMAAAHYASVMRARHGGSHVSFLTADSILGDGSLAAARRYVDDGKLAVMFAGLEVERDGFIAAIRDDGGPVLAIAPRDMVGHALAHLHPDTANLTLRPGHKTSAAIPHPVMFPIAGGLIQHGFHMGPLMLSATAAARPFAPDFLTSDTRLTRLALNGDDPAKTIKVVDDSDEIACVSMSRQLPKTLTSKPFNAEDLGVWASRWCFAIEDVPFFEWSFRQRRALRGAGAGRAIPASDAYETAIVETVLSAFRRNAITRAAKR